MSASPPYSPYLNHSAASSASSSSSMNMSFHHRFPLEREYASSTTSMTPTTASSQASESGGEANGAAAVRSKKRRGNLPKKVTDILRAWFSQHIDHPYPSEEDKQMLINQTGLSISQISNWFINARRRQLPALRQQARASSAASAAAAARRTPSDANERASRSPAA
ncbi:hypothetical protein KEM55_008994 [Ascosphaera atra]|nr:hypothetical protein KEM55_008994 [Ascosphaera atra]